MPDSTYRSSWPSISLAYLLLFISSCALQVVHLSFRYSIFVTGPNCLRENMSVSLPYVNGTNGAIDGSKRTITKWGSPLPTRNLTPHDDVQFDPALKPRAHRMPGNA